MKIAAVIPARMASTRFPGKPLVNIMGLPMIEHVRRRVALCTLVNEVIVATCDEEIYQTVSDYGGTAVMTSDKHERCTDRIAEAVINLDSDIIINVQGDEPLVRPEMLELLLEPFLHNDEILCTNLMIRIIKKKDFVNSNVVKVVYDNFNNALYYSRLPIPNIGKHAIDEVKSYQQLGIIAFRKSFLETFSKLAPTPNEILESVDMLRAIEHGYKVKMVEAPYYTIGVDTKEDLIRAEELLANDDILQEYITE